MGFPKPVRLRKSAEFKSIKGTKLKVSNPYLLLLAKATGHPTPRLGLAVAKKNVKLAVKRNRIKRIARESFRHCRAFLPNIDIILLVRSGINDLDNKQLQLCLEKSWKQLTERAKKQLSC